MTHKFECEYLNAEGECDYFDIELESNPSWQDDSFSHEFGVQHYDPYPILEEMPTWDKDFYTFSENWLIAIWLMANYSWVEHRIIKEYEEQCEIYADMT